MITPFSIRISPSLGTGAFFVAQVAWIASASWIWSGVAEPESTSSWPIQVSSSRTSE